jgi:hypothetical protein
MDIVLAATFFRRQGTSSTQGSMEFTHVLIGRALRAALAALLMLVAFTPTFAEAACFEGCVSAFEAADDSLELAGTTAENSSPDNSDQNRSPQPIPCSFGHGVHIAGLPAAPLQDIECRTAGGSHTSSLDIPLAAIDPDRRERPPQA